MKKLFVLLMVLVPVLCSAQQFSMGPMFLQEKQLQTDYQRNFIAWEASAMFFEREVFGKYSVRWWDEKIRLQELRLGYSLSYLKPFASVDFYEGTNKFGGGGVILIKNSHTFMSLMGKGYEGGYGLNASLGFLKNGNIFEVGYEQNKYNDTIFSGAKVNFGFLF